MTSVNSIPSAGILFANPRKERRGIGNKKIGRLEHSSSHVKQLWLIASKRKSLWTDWVNDKYLKGTSIWEVNPHHSSSWGWRGLLRVRDKAKPLIRHIIGNDTSTRFWTDPWLDNGSLLDAFSDRAIYDLGQDKNVLVAEYISEGNFILPTPISSDIIEIRRMISQYELPISPMKDFIAWTPSSNGGWGG